ncbi:LacI family DNA-binding transcriptional regulator [Herbiconiux sp. VKM Ac-1786]|uniref:LacI family DNA-binding transcriptional regulator n=1 Tax=Herbiconiux sp. VKM Ac-1786 TaxID=2783824 RepID=UPI00188BA23E|nr:LacI family DNA-binding transcriptional regulator [Herbiconiux sp. VKM Ac-1786]MBF4572808.1 LacI family DNA-binding transcriptional regulator [Herbiconiux sp. VKM Ac-1786]
MVSGGVGAGRAAGAAGGGGSGAGVGAGEGAARVRAASVFDVAKAAGVSHQTVSRVLNDHPSLRPVTRQKVLDAMRELDYRPNLAARALVTSRSRIIGILSTSSGEYGPASSIAAVEAAARARGYSVSIANADGVDQRSIDEALEHLVDLSAEGIVVIAPQLQVLSALSARSFRIPFVTLQTLRQVDGAELALDQVTGARLATAHLAELGHRRIGHLAGAVDWIDAVSRRAGFAAELETRGIAVGPVAAGDWSAPSGYRAGQELIAAGVTAVFSANDQMALGLLHAAHDAGLAVPRDLSVVGFDDTPEAAHYLPPLTTVRQDFAEAGRRALARLLDEDGTSPSAEPALVVRASTAPPL